MNGVVRLVSWNLTYGKPGRYKRIENRRRQWALLGALAPDLALLQECRPSDLDLHAPAWMADEYRCVGTLRPGWRLCTSILVHQAFHVEPLEHASLGEAERRWLGYAPGCTAAAALTVGSLELAVASVHALAGKVDVGTEVTLAEHERIRRTGLDRAIYNDLLAAALEPWVAGRHFIVGGDWNDSPLFDALYPKGAYGVAGSSTEFYERRKHAGWFDAMRKFHDTEIRTYLEKNAAPYELDRVFTDSQTYRKLLGCHVLDDVTVTGLSDHAPLVIEFTN